MFRPRRRRGVALTLTLYAGATTTGLSNPGNTGGGVAAAAAGGGVALYQQMDPDTMVVNLVDSKGRAFSTCTIQFNHTLPWQFNNVCAAVDPCSCGSPRVRPHVGPRHV